MSVVAKLRRSLTRPLVLTSVSLIMSQGVTAAIGIATARPLGPDGKGLITAVVTWTQLVTWFALSGVNTAIGVRVAEAAGARARTALGNAVVHSLVVGGACAVGAGMLLPGVIGQLGPRASTLVVLLAATIPAAVILELLLTIHLSSGRVRLYNLARTASPFVMAVVAIGFVAAGTMTSTTYVVSVIAGLMAAIVIALPRLPWRSLRVDLHELGTDLRFGLKVHVGSLIAIANARLDIVVMSTFMAAAPLGLYGLANNVMAPVTAVAAALCTLVTPAVARLVRTDSRDGELEQVEQIRAAARRAILLAIAGGACVALLAPVLIPFAFGSAFHGAVKLAWILVPGWVARSYASVVSAGCAGMRRAWSPTIIEAAGLVATAALLAPLVLWLGVTGAAVTSTVAYTLSAGAAVYLLRRIGGAESKRVAVSAVPAVVEP